MFASSAQAGDWPRWRGPGATGVSSEKWAPSGKFTQVWKASVGEGYSSVAVAGGRVYTQGNSGSQDTLWCLDAGSGKAVWKHSYPCPKGSDAYTGPRATPTVDGGVVYFAARDGQVGAVSTSGKKIWQKNVAKEIGAPEPQWAFASSPLAEGKLLILNMGSSGVALDKKTGKVVWKSKPGKAGYATPVAAMVGGKRVVAIFAGTALMIVNPANGAVLGSYPWTTQYDVNAADPIFSGSSVFISSGYNHGGALLNLAGGKPAKVWESKEMRNHCNACLLIGGHLYGNDNGALKCVELKTGKEKWSKGGMGGSQPGVSAAGEKVIGLTGNGELFVCKASPAGHSEIARGKVLSGQCWTAPVLANGRVFCRSHEGDLVCVK
jgi:outer membrane protein assembly factor BamB